MSRFERLLDWLEQYRAAIEAGEPITIKINNHPHELRNSVETHTTLK